MSARDEILRAALERYTLRASARVAGAGDVNECRRVLREEAVRTLEELGLDVAHDPMAQARLDYGVAAALETLDRLTSDGA